MSEGAICLPARRQGCRRRRVYQGRPGVEGSVVARGVSPESAIAGRRSSRVSTFRSSMVSRESSAETHRMRCLRKFPSCRFLLQIPRTRALRNRQTESGVLRLALFTRDPDPTEDVEGNDETTMESCAPLSTLEVCRFVPGLINDDSDTRTSTVFWGGCRRVIVWGWYDNQSRRNFVDFMPARCLNIVSQHGVAGPIVNSASPASP
ncbi:hypothetical protein QBC39DRAFT_97178 [Podospora conica]|nr:hypothetical protein QBC39DRAFT_97178 [Schizothecium conicum]